MGNRGLGWADTTRSAYMIRLSTPDLTPLRPTRQLCEGAERLLLPLFPPTVSTRYLHGSAPS
eukprot:173276-Chlamydomonas_euryale.AAC.1